MENYTIEKKSLVSGIYLPVRNLKITQRNKMFVFYTGLHPGSLCKKEPVKPLTLSINNQKKKKKEEPPQIPPEKFNKN